MAQVGGVPAEVDAADAKRPGLVFSNHPTEESPMAGAGIAAALVVNPDAAGQSSHIGSRHQPAEIVIDSQLVEFVKNAVNDSRCF